MRFLLSFPSRRFRAGARRALAGWFALVALFAAVGDAHAIRSDVAIHETFEDFHSGEFERISLSRDGALQLSPAAEMVAELPEPIVWTAVAGNDGELYVGTGNEGKVIRIRPGEEPEEIFESEEVLVRALALGPDGALYVGTSPDGRVYRVDLEADRTAEEDEGEGPRIFFDPGAAYIWDLLFDADGYLLVATGDEGKIFRVPPDGEIEGEADVFFESGESHVSVMAWDREERLLVGTSPHGYLYRVEEPGKAFVLFNSPDEEIRRIVVDEDGTVFAATFAGNGGGRRLLSAYISQAMSAIEQAGAGETNGQNNRDSRAGEGNSNGQGVSAIYRIEDDGFWERYWALPEVPVHALLLDPELGLLAGTGAEAGLFSIAGLRDWHLRQRLEPGSEISALLETEGVYWALTSNPARVFRLDRDLAPEGEYVSDVFDASQTARWGRLYLEPEVRRGGGVSVSTRSGNTEEPNEFWNEWAPIRHDGAIASDPARYVQYRVELTGEEGATPELSRVRFFYQRRNAAPVVNDIRVVTGSIELERYEMPPQSPTVDLEQLFRADRSNNRQGRREGRSQVRAFERPGSITIAWRAQDPNDDELAFSVKIRRADEEEWIILGEEMDDTFLSFRSTGFEDGFYQAKVIASDHLSNPADIGLEGRRTSDYFVIDNSAPVLELEEREVDGDTVQIRFRAADEVSLIAAAGYSVNGGDLVRIFPTDRIFDSREETFEFSVSDLGEGAHHVLISVVDEAGNVRVLNVPVDRR